MGESLTQRRRVEDEGFRIVNSCRKERMVLGRKGLVSDGTLKGSTG